MEFFLAETLDTLVPLKLTINQEGVGGVTGLSPTVAVRNAATTNSYLDFADGTFKTGGWTLRDAPLTDIGDGHYQRNLNAAGVTGMAPGLVVATEYAVDNGSDIVGTDSDLIRFVASIDDIPTDVGGGGGGATGGVIVVEGELFNFLDFAVTVNTPSTGTQADRLITFDAETLGFGKVYIDSNLTIIFIKFGDATVDATGDPVDSIRLSGGTPWTVATGGFTHMSVFAAADVDITVRGLRSV